jgi:hypothetical protein
MKKSFTLLPLIFLTALSYGQRGFGFDAGFSTSKAPMVALKYFIDKNAASIGASYQVFNDALGKKEDEILQNDFAIGNGDFFYSIDVGYTRLLSEKFSVSGEVSFVKRKYYRNLSNNSFPVGGYHIIYDTKSEVDFGGFVTYYFNDLVGIFVGYNSIRHASIGVEFRFLKPKSQTGY